MVRGEIQSLCGSPPKPNPGTTSACMLAINGPDEKSIIAVEAASIHITIPCVSLNTVSKLGDKYYKWDAALGFLYNNMQYLTMIRQISMIAIAAIAIGVFLGTSLTSAAIAMGFFPSNTQSITQANECTLSTCINTASNNANSFPFSSRQSITQANECTLSTCINTASNNVR